MQKVVIYTTNSCSYCIKAKMLLQKKQVKFEEINVNSDKTREEMIAKSGGRKTVPQIFIGSKHIGGYDDLYELEKQHKLDELIN